MNALTFLLGAVAVLAIATESWPAFAAIVLAAVYCEACYRPLPPKGFVVDSEGNLLFDQRERRG